MFLQIFLLIKKKECNKWRKKERKKNKSVQMGQEKEGRDGGGRTREGRNEGRREQGREGLCLMGILG